jgi:hypothetical protein
MVLRYFWVLLTFLFLQSKRSCFPKLDAIKSATADIVSQFIFLCLYVCALLFLNYSFFLSCQSFLFIVCFWLIIMWKNDNLIDVVPLFFFNLYCPNMLLVGTGIWLKYMFEYTVLCVSFFVSLPFLYQLKYLVIIYLCTDLFWSYH